MKFFDVLFALFFGVQMGCRDDGTPISLPGAWEPKDTGEYSATTANLGGGGL